MKRLVSAWLSMTMALVLMPAAAGAGELQFGTPAVEDLHMSGAPADRVDIFLLGDGYAAGDQALWRYHSDTCFQTLKAAAPFRDILHAFNVHRINLVSNEGRIYAFPRDTALRGTLGDVTSLPNLAAALERSGSYAAEQDIVIVLMNSGGYHGFLRGNRVIVNFGGWAGRAARQMLYLLGKMHGLAEESVFYMYSQYFGPEPREPNATIQSNPALVKWKVLVGREGVGVHEGAKGFARRIYRPALTCLMRRYEKDLSYCLVCSDAIGKSVLSKLVLHYDTAVAMTARQLGPTFAFQASEVAPDATYEWDFGDGTTGAGVKVAKTYKAGTADPAHGTNEVVLTVKVGATEVGTARKTVLPVFPFAKQRTSDTDWTLDATASVVATDPLTYAWNFADSTTGSGKIVTHRFSGFIFNVVLVVKNPAGIEGKVTGVTWTFPPYVPPQQ